MVRWSWSSQTLVRELEIPFRDCGLVYSDSVFDLDHTLTAIFIDYYARFPVCFYIYLAF